jgi:OCT family organic cation transporter-like MFS transporter 4/5
MSNATFVLPPDILNISFPFDDQRETFAQCEYFSNASIESCDNFVYDTSQYESTAVTSFDLVCDRSHLRASADSLMMFGVFLGSYVFGHLSDKYGRRPVFMASLLIQVVFGLLTAISPEFITYTICRMVKRTLKKFS